YSQMSIRSSSPQLTHLGSENFPIQVYPISLLTKSTKMKKISKNRWKDICSRFLQMQLPLMLGTLFGVFLYAAFFHVGQYRPLETNPPTDRLKVAADKLNKERKGAIVKVIELQDLTEIGRGHKELGDQGLNSDKRTDKTADSSDKPAMRNTSHKRVYADVNL